MMDGSMEGDSSPRQNETSLAASYYHLFRTSSLSTNNGRQLGGDRESSTTAQTNNQDTASNTFWEEDDWTPEEEAEAENLLQQSRERCSIRNNGLISAMASEEKDDQHAWNKFYSQHQTNFFKDRHYLHKAFPDEFSPPKESTEAPDNSNGQMMERTLVEIGCGVGNALLPLLEDTDDNDDNNDNNSSNVTVRWTIFGLDLSKVAIDMMQQDARFVQAAKEGRAHAFVCDISAFPSPSNSQISSHLTIPKACQGVAHVSTLLFCLSAIAPGPRMVQAVRNVASTLRPNTGVLVFRDYGRYDEAQMKLGTSRNKKLDADNFYRKHDGTKCYYFTLEDVRTLFEVEGGLEVLELQYLRRAYRNRSTDEVRRRVWVQGRFRKVEQ